MELRGGLSTYDLSVLEKDIFADYLQHSMNNPAIEFVKYFLGDDYIKFIDVMSGTTIKIPSGKTLERDLESVKMYLYTNKRAFTEDSIKEASKVFGKSILTVRRYVLKVSKVLGTEDTLEGDALNNFITQIKSVEEQDSYYKTKLEKEKEKLYEDRRKKRLETDTDEDTSNSNDTVEENEKEIQEILNSANMEVTKDE